MTRRFNSVQRMSLAAAFTGAASVALLISAARNSWADDSDDALNVNRNPNDGADPHRFDVSAMDRSELTRAFAGQLTVLPEAQLPLKAAREIIFVDPGVPGREKLIHSLHTKATVIELVAGRDGLAQIAAALAGERNLAAVHIISHGGEARIKLAGSSDISLATLPEHLEQLKAIHNAMAPNGDVLLYGCDIAKGDDGKLFVKLLSSVIGENVAASENRTGAAARGGDWSLEYQTGTIRTRVLAPAANENYDDVLATNTVTTNADSGAGSLRATITGSANGDTIVFDPVLAGQTITLTTSGDGTFGPSALAVVNTLTIDGAAAPGLTISGDTSNPTRSLRLFIVTGTGNLTLKNITLSNGRFRGGDGAPATGTGGGGAAGLGGAIFNAGTLNLQNSTLTGNSAVGGSGGAGTYTIGTGGGGGGLGGNGVTDGNGGGPNAGIAPGGNAGIGGGGAAGPNSPPFNAGNGGFGGGGGGVPVGLSKAGNGGFGGGGSFNNGTAGFGAGAGGGFGGGGGGAGMGGAIFCYGGTLSATNCTLSGNSAIAGIGGTGGYGAGLSAASGQGLGGGIFVRNGNSTILNCTINGNAAADGGGGIFNLGDGAGNTANLTLNNTIVANSTAAVSDFKGAANATGTSTTSGAGNLIMSQTGFSGTVVSTANPQLSALANNGGPTQTQALPSTSPAINAAVNSLAPAADQRGQLRADAADIGAYEFIAVAITAQPVNISIFAGQSTTLSVTATGSALTYQWFQGASGDTSNPVPGATAASFTTPALTVTTNYWVQVSVGAVSLNSNTATVTVFTQPVLNGGSSLTTGIGVSNQFSVSASTPNATAVNWTFSDGTSASGATVSHVFTVPGSYPVTVTLTDASGQTDSLTITVTVGPTPFRLRTAHIVLSTRGDSITLSGLIHIQKGLSLSGLTFAINVGGNTSTFTINGGARVKNGANSFSVRAKTKNGVAVGDDGHFNLTLKGSLAAALKANSPLDAGGFPTQINVAIQYSGNFLGVTQLVKFKATATGAKANIKYF